MRVHARAVIHENRFRHHGNGLAVLETDILDHVLVHQHLVGHPRQRGVAHVDLGLSSGADFMMMHLHLDTDLFQRAHHLRAQILHVIHRRHREVALFVARLVAQVLATGITGVPESLDRVDVIEALVVGLVKADIVEDIELDLRSPVTEVGDPSALEMLFGLLRRVTRIAGVGLAGHRILDVTNNAERGYLRKRIDKGSLCIRHQ